MFKAFFFREVACVNEVICFTYAWIFQSMFFYCIYVRYKVCISSIFLFKDCYADLFGHTNAYSHKIGFIASKTFEFKYSEFYSYSAPGKVE